MPEEVIQEVVLKTQKCLGKYVKTPPLTEKLLKKPPFRFLHDVVNTVIRDTGFLKGLFSEDELNSENVKDRAAKIAFLSKLINAVKVITHTDLSVRPSKVVAGLEPTETNLLLQTIATAIEKKIDSSNYISQLQSSEPDENHTNFRSPNKGDKTKKSKLIIKKKIAQETIKKEIRKDTQISTSTERNKLKHTLKEFKDGSVEGKIKSKQMANKKEKEKETNDKEATQISEIIENFDCLNESSQNVEKPSVLETNSLNDIVNSVKSEPNEETLKLVETKVDVNIKNETKTKRDSSAPRPKSARPQSSDKGSKSIQIKNRPQSSLRPPSVRPSSARPGAPHLRPDLVSPFEEVILLGKINVIVENFDANADEEETVVINNNPENNEHNENISTPPVHNKGHLVEQILEQINENGDKIYLKIDNSWQKDSKDASKETNILRSLIQNLTKIANPLGMLLNYLHEDIDAMHNELETWTTIKQQLYDEMIKQKKIRAEMNKPLISQLEHLNREVKKLEEEIATTRSNILRNELKIKELLVK